MKAAVIGYGRSGKISLDLLKLKGYNNIDIYDDVNKDEYKDILSYKDQYDTTIVTPGLDIKRYPHIKGNIMGEIELAYSFFSKGSKIIGVTGTNGKSTTTFLTAQLLNFMGIKAVACGNIGLPFGEVVLNKDIEVFVIELSSFQIELLKNFQADAACIMNITPDHLDRYGLIENYYKAKLKLLDHIKPYVNFITNRDDKIIDKLEESNIKYRVIDEDLNSYPLLKRDKLILDSLKLNLKNYNLFGKHNILNLSFAIALISSLYELDDSINGSLSGLKGLPHRTELISEKDNIRWINDSKGTNVDSVYTALMSLNKPSILMLGGQDKGSDYRKLAELINKSVSKVYYFGEAANLIRANIDNMIDIESAMFSTLEDSVRAASLEVKPGYTVLLSPGCSSFDEFESYEDRGNKFRQYVLKYTGDN